MKNVFEQIKEELQERMNLQMKLMSMVETVEQVAAENNNRWIPSEQKLPPEPKIKLLWTEEVEDAIEQGKIKEYLVTIQGAEDATTLYYIGDNKWCDCTAAIVCPVDAWMSMPAAYRPEGGKV